MRNKKAWIVFGIILVTEASLATSHLAFSHPDFRKQLFEGWDHGMWDLWHVFSFLSHYPAGAALAYFAFGKPWSSWKAFFQWFSTGLCAWTAWQGLKEAFGKDWTPWIKSVWILLFG